MNRWATYLIGPETVLTVITIVIFSICSRHNSGEGKDVELMEKLVMGIAFWLVPLVFLTIFVPGARNWWWLGRASVLTLIMLLVMAGRLIAGFGTGAKGQDAGFLMVMCFGTVMIAICGAITGAMVLAETKPAFANWFGNHRLLGSLAVAASTIPFAIALGILQMIAIAIYAFWVELRR